MNSNAEDSRRATRGRHAQLAAWMIALTAAVFACSVYDESLRQGVVEPGGAAGADDGGSSSASGGVNAGGGAGATSGGELVDAGAPGAAGHSGEPPKAGASNGGGAGAGSVGGAGAHSGGGAGAHSGGTGGGVVSGGNAGVSASGAAGGGTAGVAGSAHELGVGKPTSASTQQPANPSAAGNDGQTATRWSATTGTLPQWWRVDLGASHVLTQVSLQFENPDRKYSYLIETSADDATYTTQASVDAGTGALQTLPMPSNVSARYVRVTVTATVPGVDAGGNPRPTWASFWEVSVLGT